MLYNGIHGGLEGEGLDRDVAELGLHDVAGGLRVYVVYAVCVYILSLSLSLRIYI